MIRRRTITSYVWNSVSGNKMVILSNCIRNFFRKFELLGNSTQGENPAPDNPQEIKSVGRKSKNLFNIADLRVGQVQKDGTINEKSTHYRTAILDVPEDAKYRIAFKINTDYNMLYFTDAYINGVYSNPYVKVYGGNSGSLISLKNGKNILSFRATKDDATIDFPKDHNIMIAAESETLGYEPYGYFFDVKITGKNLFSNKSADWQIGKGLSWSTYPNDPISIYRVINSAVNVINLKPSTTYSIVNNSEKIVISRMIERNLSENGIKDHDVRSSKYTFVTNQNAMNAILQLKKVDGTELLSSDIESIKIMLVEGDIDESTPYEPYTEQSVQIALDEPLRGIGDYKDVLTKDGVVRRIKQITVDEKSNLIFYTESKNTFGYLVKVPDATQTNYIYSVISDRFVKTQYIDSNDTNGVVTLFGKQIIFRVSKEIANSIDALKEWLANNNITFNYVLESPITEPLPESVQAQLSALHSENGTTHVFVDFGEVEAGINIEYKYKS